MSFSGGAILRSKTRYVLESESRCQWSAPAAQRIARDRRRRTGGAPLRRGEPPVIPCSVKQHPEPAPSGTRRHRGDGVRRGEAARVRVPYRPGNIGAGGLHPRPGPPAPPPFRLTPPPLRMPLLAPAGVSEGVDRDDRTMPVPVRARRAEFRSRLYGADVSEVRVPLITGTR